MLQYALEDQTMLQDNGLSMPSSEISIWCILMKIMMMFCDRYDYISYYIDDDCNNYFLWSRPLRRWKFRCQSVISRRCQRNTQKGSCNIDCCDDNHDDKSDNYDNFGNNACMMIMRTTMMKTMTVNITEPVEIVTTRMFIDNYNENYGWRLKQAGN